MTKTHFKKMQNPNYLGSWDLYDSKGNMNDLVLTIKEVKKQQVFDGKGGSEDCPIMYFVENVKPMVMNATNLKTVSKITGTPFIEEWNGVKVQVTVKKVKAFGEMHDALRIVQKAVALPELCPKHERWSAAKLAVKNKTTTIAKIRESYILSDANAKLLENETV